MELLLEVKQTLIENHQLTKAEKLEMVADSMVQLLPPMVQSTCRVFMSSYLNFDDVDESTIDDGIAIVRELLDLLESE